MALEAAAIGLAAGIVAGLLGVGGGILFVPALTLVLGLSQVAAEGTSLLAVLPVAIVGTLSQRRYGNVRASDALALGLLSAGGAAGGVALANVLSGTALRVCFALFMLAMAGRLAASALRRD